jgi:hypothetical protein
MNHAPLIQLQPRQQHPEACVNRERAWRHRSAARQWTDGDGEVAVIGEHGCKPPDDNRGRRRMAPRAAQGPLRSAGDERDLGQHYHRWWCADAEQPSGRTAPPTIKSKTCRHDKCGRQQHGLVGEVAQECHDAQGLRANG